MRNATTKDEVTSLVDKAWYLSKYKDVKASGTDAAVHYMTKGWSEGRDPNPFFQTNWYLNNNPDVNLSGVNPLFHYVMYGASEGRNPNPYFNTRWYSNEYPEVASSGLGALRHFIEVGQFQDLDPSILFDTEWYRHTHPNFTHEGATPFEHFILYGVNGGQLPPELIEARQLFDSKWYLAKNPDIRNYRKGPTHHYFNQGYKEGRLPGPYFDLDYYLEQQKNAAIHGDQLIHFCRTGWRKGLNPNPFFFTNWYLDENPDVKNEDINPLLHYIISGADEDRKPNPYFLGSWYQEEYPEATPSNLMALQHFIEVGQFKDFDPCPRFDTEWYRNTYPDVAGAGMFPFQHFLRYGMEEKRLTSDSTDARLIFDSNWYIAKNSDVRNFERGPLFHYFNHGHKELREPSPFFDTKYYIEQCPEVRANSDSALSHYCRIGRFEGLNPNPFFHTNWYLEVNPDVRLNGINPLLHYIVNGAEEGRDPNQYFNASWYLKQYADPGVGTKDALRHYVEIGQLQGFDPSPLFDTQWYCQTNPDIVDAKMFPYQHFLRYGAKEGRDPSRNYDASAAASAAKILCVKPPNFAKDIALFVTHSPRGSVKRHVLPYVKSLKRNGVDVILIIATDSASYDLDPLLTEATNGLYIRENIGFDFAAWSHILQLNPELMEADTVYFTNDSLIGPLNDAMFDKLIADIRSSNAAMVGLTDNYEIKWHIQSYFLALKYSALQSVVFREFIYNLRSYTTKTRVINEYETQMAEILISAGLECDVLFKSLGSHSKNRTIYHWKELIEEGFPFLKVGTIRDNYPDVDTTSWTSVAAALGYDTSLADDVLNVSSPTLDNRSDHSTDAPDFSKDLYLALYPDVAAAGANPYKHYLAHGRAEGRIAKIKNADRRSISSRLTSGKETVLLVSHEGVRGGAPILCYNIVEKLVNKYNVVIIFLADGPMVEACSRAGAVVVGPIGVNGMPLLSEYLINEIRQATSIKYAILNTLGSTAIVAALGKNYVPITILVHEFLSYFRPKTSFLDAAFWANNVVFSAKLTKDDALFHFPDVESKPFMILPQGRCALPVGSSLTEAPYPEDNMTRSDLELEEQRNGKEFLVLGAGTCEYRKGVDIFIMCALRLKSLRPDISWKFRWIGKSYNPSTGDYYSMFVSDQVRRSGLSGEMGFFEEQESLSELYQAADILLLSSRLDPLPNVAIDAMSVGLPVFCFDGASGIADILLDYEIGRDCVANYMDIEDLAYKITRSIAQNGKLKELSMSQMKIADNVFDMDQYVTRLDHLSSEAGFQCLREYDACRTILESKLFNAEYSFFDRQLPHDHKFLMREYVRSWATGINLRRPFPGFHPGRYAECQNLNPRDIDPLTHFIEHGEPPGSWMNEVICDRANYDMTSKGAKVAVHIHCYYLDIFSAILGRLSQSSISADLFISVRSSSDAAEVERMVGQYSMKVSKISIVPNVGRDIGPFLFEFGREISENYEIVGHFHTKKTVDLSDRNIGARWYEFLLENLIGGKASMADIIVDRLIEDKSIGMVFPDDPHVVGWGLNRPFAEDVWKNISNDALPENFLFPVGTMFWARTSVILPLISLNYSWSDCPPEPLPYDGSFLHGLERLFGLTSSLSGRRICTTNVKGITR